MKAKFIVEIDIPRGMSVDQMRKYITTAVVCDCGGYAPEDPIYHLDRESVKVKILKEKS